MLLLPALDCPGKTPPTSYSSLRYNLDVIISKNPLNPQGELWLPAIQPCDYVSQEITGEMSNPSPKMFPWWVLSVQGLVLNMAGPEP